VHVRQGLAGLDAGADARTTVDASRGYLEDAGQIDRYKRLSIPVRRALNPGDRASFAQTLGALAEAPGADQARLCDVRDRWQRLQDELDTQIGLGGGKVARRQILTAWLDAAAFYDTRDHDRAYDHLLDRWGKAAEGIGSQLMDDAARLVVALDDLAAVALGEPAILPPPLKTPPPPKDPEERWWKKLFG